MKLKRVIFGKVKALILFGAMTLTLSAFGQGWHEWDELRQYITGGPFYFADNNRNSIPGGIIGGLGLSTNCQIGYNCLSLDGNGCISLNNASLPAGNAPRSISAWAKSTNVTGVKTIFGYGTAATNQSIFIGQNGASLVAGAYGNTITVPNFWIANVWHHIALTYDGNTAKLYADGVMLISAAMVWNTTLNNAYIGNNVNGTEYWVGLIDDVRLDTQVWTPTVIAGQVKEATKTIAEWPMENATTGFFTTTSYADPYSSTSYGTPTFTSSSRDRNYAISLNGNGQYISKGSIALSTGSDPFTVAAWAKTNTTAGRHMIMAYGLAPAGQSVYISQNGTSLVAGTLGGSTISIPNFWIAGAWHRITLTYDGAVARLYSDGALQGSFQDSFSIQSGAVTYVGRSIDNDASGYSYWNGDLDEVKIYSTPLSVPEIQSQSTSPTPPSSITVGTTDVSSVTLNWTDTNANGANYYIEKSLSPSSGFSQTTTSTSNSCTVTNLAEGQVYYFRIRAIKSGVNSDYATTVSGSTLLNAPTLLSGVSSSSTAITLNWSDNSQVETGYRVERSTTPGSGYTVVSTVGKDISQFTDTGLTPGITYYYKVAALGVSASYSTETMVTTMTTMQQSKIQEAINNFAFQYKYDGRGRMVEKKVPGSDWVYMVYDGRDRVVMSQDGNQRTGNQWLLTKYDTLNRPVMTAIYTHGTTVSQDSMSRLLSATKFSEVYAGAAQVSNHGYTLNVWPKTNLTVLTVNYYDNYNFVSDLSFGSNFSFATADVTGQQTPFNSSLQGHPTGGKVNVLGTTNYLKSVTYYDDKYRTIQSIADNNKSGFDRMTTVVDFTGRVLNTKTTHHTSTHSDQTIARRMVYDHGSRVKQIFHNVNSVGEKLLAQNDYNEIGQLVDKKLYSTDGLSFKQSVDYRYNIRGWLSSMNNSQLVNDQLTNDDNTDLFGFELGYNNSIGTSNSNLYNGNISAMKWSSNLALGTIKDVGYNYSYDALNRITAASYLSNTSGVWSNPTNAFNESGYQYDLNGNIKTLKRFGSTGNVMDSLHYTYNGNQLLKVKDNGGDLTKGFIDGANTGNDYTYDVNGNMVSDQNKSLMASNAIQYNHLNLPIVVTKSTNEKIVYTYDAGGRKLKQEVYNASNQVIKTTDYDGEFIYQGDTLKFINHEEGRIVMNLAPNQVNTTALNEYQYHLKDHLGNVRLTFTTTPSIEANTATYEPTNANVEQSKFLRYTSARRINATLFDHTNGSNPGYSERLNGSANEKYGLARSISVMPGDIISAEVYAKYADPNSANWNTALSNLMSQIATNNASVIYDGVSYSSSTSSFPTGYGSLLSKTDDGAPKAYLNWLVFDRSFVVQAQSGFKQITTVGRETGTDVAHEYLTSGNITITQPGYVYIYLSNEATSPVEVFFDDLKVTQTNSMVVQQEDYYPFGLTFNSYQRENNVPQNFLYGSKEKINDLGIDWYDFEARMYMPEIGRWGVIDPMAEKYDDLSPYNYALNNPIYFSDPNGMDPSSVADLVQHAWNSTPEGRNASYDANGSCTCGCPGKPPCEEKKESQVEGSMMTAVNNPGVGVRKGKDGALESFETPGAHECDENCTQEHFDEGDMARAYAEVGLFFVGGQGVKWLLRGGKWVLTAVNASRFGQFAYASKYGIQSYRTLRALAKGKNLQIHHLIEKRFASLLGQKANNMASVALTQGEHQAFTNAWRSAIPYGEGTINATRDQVMNAAKQIYKDYPEILNALGLK